MPPIFGRAYKSDYDSIYGKEFDIREHWSRPYLIRENGSRPEHQEYFYGGFGDQPKELLDERIRNAYPDAILCESKDEEDKWMLLI
jgi:hypothetical protein